MSANADKNDAASPAPPRVTEGNRVSESPAPRSPLAARVALVGNVLQTEGLVGLREVDAHARLQQDGPNELPVQQKRTLLTIVLEVVREPMFLMLVAAGVVYLLLGEPADALMLLGFVFVVMAITIVQARRTEHALEALRDLSSPRALVIRDGQRRRIAGREVVAGDLVVLAEGDRVPADGLLRQALHLAADESLLTGESVPVRKVPSADARALERPGGDDLPSVFSGTLLMAMAILPEEFPVVLTIFLALGAWRLSRSRVLTRRMPAVEMLGAATVLCVDKTGTLTQNQMTLRKLAIGSSATDLGGLAAELPEELHSLLEHAILASKRDPFDPMERALHEAGDRLIKNTEHLHPSWSLEREYPLTPGLPAVSHAWRSGSSDDVVVSTKGAPEAVADLCHLAAEERASLASDVLNLASQGLRVLGVARGATRVGSVVVGRSRGGARRVRGCPSARVRLRGTVSVHEVPTCLSSPVAEPEDDEGAQGCHGCRDGTGASGRQSQAEQHDSQNAPARPDEGFGRLLVLLDEPLRDDLLDPLRFRVSASEGQNT